MDEKKYKKHLTAWIIITIVLVIISFYGGYKHGQSSAKAALAARAGAFGAGGARTGATAGRFGAGGGAVSGSVIAKDATSITVQDRTGSSKIILYSGSTSIGKMTSGTIDDVAVGSQVSVVGTQNSDGSVTAQSIQIRPAMPATPAGTPAPAAGTQ